MYIIDVLSKIFAESGFAGIFEDPRYLVMILIACFLLYLGIGKKFEPLLMVTIAFGMLMTNLPGANMFHEIFFAGGHVHWDLIGGAPITQESACFAQVAAAIRCACENLARKIAADGEGATKLVTVDVVGAATAEDADIVARAIANSPLVKTAIFGHDANWGRVAGAAGKCGVVFDQYDVDIDFLGVPVLRAGLPLPMDEDDMLRRFEAPEIDIAISLGVGDAHARIWSCDLSYEYVTINGDYRT